MRPATFSAFAALAVGAGAAASQALAEESPEDAGGRKDPSLRNNAGTPHAWLRSPAAEAYEPSAQQPSAEQPTPAANENSGEGLLTTNDLSGEPQASAGADENRAIRVPVATAFAASLTASQETCMGSRSFGVQAIGFGLSVATTWPDRQCRRIRNARALEEFGYRSAALALLCQDEEVFEAMQRAGTPCPGAQLLTFPLPPTPEPEPAEPPLMRLQNVLFDFDRSNLRPEADAILMPVLEMLQRDATLNVDIEGHADWMGSDAYNIGLSQRRAQAVVEWLVAHGIARERLHAVGKGEREPIASNETAEGRQLNRRVEVRRR